MLQAEQRSLLSDDPTGHVFLIATGVVMLEARVAGQQKRVLEILFAGDVFSTVETPRLPDTALVAATPAELLRYRANLLEAARDTDAQLVQDLSSALSHRSARRTLHIASLGELDAEGRLADALVEIGLHIGQSTAAGLAFELPFSREQIASYLALNPDTLSRLFTRLKSRGVIAVAQRHIVIREWDQLCALGPLTKAHIDLAARRRGQQVG